MAPEVLTRTEYQYSPDWWGLGVTLWELLTGKVPYMGTDDEDMCVLHWAPLPPTNFLSTDVCVLLYALLDPCLDTRLGRGEVCLSLELGIFLMNV